MSSPSPSPSLAVDAREVTKTYGSGATGYQALRGVDFAVARGEFVMLSGPSGSGKTTLLSILGCALTATSGVVRILGEDVSARPEKELPALRLAHVGFVFQQHGLIASLTASENVRLLLELRGWSRLDARAESARLLELVGLGDKLDSRPRDLSGGQRQRIAIARAVAGSPPLLLCDEPTASLDAENGKLVIALLRDLAGKQGHTVVVVTHDNRIFHFADRIVHIEDGRIVPSREAAA
jgi:putative ABC transport system ATP-binding protein